MKYKIFILAASLSIIFAVGFLASGCGPRTEVIVDKVKKALDAQIGSIDVQIKELDAQMASLKTTSKEIEKASLKAKLEVEKINEDTKPIENRKMEIEKALSSLRDALKDSKANNKPILVGKKEVKPEEFNGMVEKLIDARKPLLDLLDSQNQSKKSLENVVSNLNAKESKIKTALSKFESKRAELLVQKDAAITVQNASKVNAGQNIDEQIKAVEGKIRDIQTDVKLSLAESSFSADQSKEVNEIDTIIKNTKSSEDVMGQLDKILGTPEKSDKK